MTELKELSIAELGKKVDDQARFTRTVTIVCTLSILGFMFYMITEIFSNLPSAFLLHYMANLEKIVYEWNAVENNVARSKANAANATTTPAKVAK